jgi:hypothetical protein
MVLFKTNLKLLGEKKMRDWIVDFVSGFSIYDLVYLGLIIVSFAVCYHRLSVLSHRIDMVIMVQQSQEESFRRSLERDADLLLKLGKIEQLLEENK